MPHIKKTDQEYQRRQIVARMGKAGYFNLEGRRYVIWQFMTFWCGPGQPSIAAEFKGPAAIDSEGFARIDDLKPGELLVTPGLIYKKIPMSGQIMAEHMKKMKKFTPRELVEYVKDTSAGVVDLGTTDMRKKH